MRMVSLFWIRPGNQIPYTGLRQTNNTCVFVSIASAVNWLTQSNLTENEVVHQFQVAGQQEINFTTVSASILSNFPDIEAIRYRDDDNPLTDLDELLERVNEGAVLVLSLEIAALTGNAIQRLEPKEWHMLSIFKGGGSDAQVWDSNGHAGFLSWAEVRELLAGDTVAIPYPPIRCLVAHEQHDCLLVARRQVHA
jgi:hypothetical protein